jgi:four helix bundle protein
MAGVRRYSDLIAWKLANQLEREIFALTQTGPCATDFRFSDQIRESSASATRNIAEGFGRFGSAEFARFLEFARGSLTETHNSVQTGFDRGYWTSDVCNRLSSLAGRSAIATTRLIGYLKTQRKRQRTRTRRRSTPRDRHRRHL